MPVLTPLWCGAVVWHDMRTPEYLYALSKEHTMRASRLGSTTRRVVVVGAFVLGSLVAGATSATAAEAQASSVVVNPNEPVWTAHPNEPVWTAYPDEPVWTAHPDEPVWT